MNNKCYHRVPEMKKERETCEGICPYYLRDRGNGLVYCECARFRFPDKLARREIVYGYCAHPDHYKQCPIKQTMDHFYERKYSMIDADERGASYVQENDGQGTTTA
ncbi:MAG: hypothetical protein J6D87_00605 [Clostridia bacterium]|nr:hypothetical protein [Clostridia bacterium]MBQ7317051.1 hypothetical protein [Clostridia bacterium]